MRCDARSGISCAALLERHEVFTHSGSYARVQLQGLVTMGARSGLAPSGCPGSPFDAACSVSAAIACGTSGTREPALLQKSKSCYLSASSNRSPRNR